MSKARKRLTAADRLAVRHEENEKDERRTAICQLLRKPMLTASGNDAEAFITVRRHAQWLKSWFTRWPNWTLVITADVVRLRKHPSPRKDATRGLTDNSSSERIQFTRRRYALLCLVLATLESEQRQTTIQQVARKTEVMVRVSPELAELDFAFDPKLLPHRRELVAVLRFLQQQHVLNRADGDDTGYVRGTGDCLYRIERASLSMMLCSVNGASTLGAPTGSNDSQHEKSMEDFIFSLNEIETPEFDEAQNRELQNLLVRRLLDDPVMYYDDLTPREYSYFNDQGERIIKELQRSTGMIAERRAEGVALLDPTGNWTDLGLPETGTRGHATLLLAEWFGQRLREQEVVESKSTSNSTSEIDPATVRIGVPKISIEDARAYVEELAATHQRRWRKHSNTPEGINRILDESLYLLESLALIEIVNDKIKPRPAVARYCLGEVVAPSSEARS